jgi:transposase-like protein
MTQLSFKRHHFPPQIIRHTIWLYARFTLSLRDVEETPPPRAASIFSTSR